MKKAFTLFEVLVVVLLASVVFAGLFLVMSSGRTTWYSADTRIALQEELRKAMRQISDDLRSSGATQISIPADGAAYSSVSFNISEGAFGAGAVNWSTDAINYSLSSGQIIRARGADNRVIANNITNLIFVRQVASSRVVRINVTASKSTVFGGVLNASLDSAVALRN